MRIRMGMGARKMAAQMMGSRRQTGLSCRSSLLPQASGSGRKGISTRMDMMKANTVQSARLERGKYDRLQKSADGLTDSMKLLAEKADAGEKDIAATAADMVEEFNDTMKNLRQTSGVLNDFYRQSLKETVTTNKKELEKIGITVASDGTLSLNREKLGEAPEEMVKEILGSSGDLAKRIQTVASRAADNARTSSQSVYSQYNASGGILAGSYLSRYNFRG